MNPVTVIGAGIAGATCARYLHDVGVDVHIVDRGRAPGGRMASPVLRDRRVDIGAGYFTVRDNDFQAVVDRWSDAGLARPWTDTFGVLGSEPTHTTSGPRRWATPHGLRSLVRAVLGDIPVTVDELRELPDGDVVLAMPDPQAARLRPIDDEVAYEPVIAVVCEYDSQTDFLLPFLDAAFVNDHPTLSFIADDGARRGDGAPVLVAHSTASVAAKHLDQPDDAIAPVIAALSDLCDLPVPTFTFAHRWTFAKPIAQHSSSYAIVESDGRIIGHAGDQWCPDGAPRIESAWRSGIDLATAIVARRGNP